MSIKNLLRLNSLFQHDFGAVPCSNETRLKSVTLAKTNMEATGHVKNSLRIRGKDIKLSHVVQGLDTECYPADAPQFLKTAIPQFPKRKNYDNLKLTSKVKRICLTW